MKFKNMNVSAYNIIPQSYSETVMSGEILYKIIILYTKGSSD